MPITRFFNLLRSVFSVLVPFGSRRSSLFLATLIAPFTALAAPADAANPPRPPFREGKADYHDKELALNYAWGGPAGLDFALISPLSLGVSVDHIFQPQSWAYRTTLKLVDEEEAGIGIAATGALTSIRENIACQTDNLPVWGWQAGILTTLMTESGLTFRLGIQAYDTESSAAGGQGLLLTPEIAYRMGIVEVMVIPTWPINDVKAEWVGLRVRI
jgi:hypothetical protein